MTPWANISLTAVAAAGDLTQLYPAGCTAGSGATTMGTEVRQPTSGLLMSFSVEPDGVNGGEIQLYDINGAEAGADVDTATVISNAQLAAAIAAGKAHVIYQQKFVGTASTTKIGGAVPITITHGLAARFVAAAGTCEVNIVASGCARKIQICGA